MGWSTFEWWMLKKGGLKKGGYFTKGWFDYQRVVEGWMKGGWKVVEETFEHPSTTSHGHGNGNGSKRDGYGIEFCFLVQIVLRPNTVSDVVFLYPELFIFNYLIFLIFYPKNTKTS